jgi:hypothetical protein
MLTSVIPAEPAGYASVARLADDHRERIWGRDPEIFDWL